MKIIILLISTIFLISCDSDRGNYVSILKKYRDRKNMFYHDENIIIGIKIPEFKLEIEDSTILIPINNNNSFTLINIWFKECEPCIKEIPAINSLLKKDNLNIVSICRNPVSDFDSSTILEKIEYIVSFNNAGLIDSTLYWSFGYPGNILLNKNGVIIKNIGMLFEDTEQYDNLIEIIR